LRPVEKVLEAVDDYEERSDGYWCICPNHDDHYPSLHLKEAKDGTALLICRAGCDQADVLAALEGRGVQKRDLFADNAGGSVVPIRDGNSDRSSNARRGHPAHPRARGRIVETYDYADEHGQLLYQTVRFIPKDFRQRKPDGRGGWDWTLQDVRLVPYRLPELLAADRGQLVLVCAGEKDVERARELGFVSTTNPLGEGKWREAYSEHLRSRRVAVIPHNDGPGEKHGEAVARSLHGKAASVKVLRLPGVPEGGGDLSDWADAGGTAEDLRRLIDETPEWSPSEQREVGRAGEEPPSINGRGAGESYGDFNLTDLGNSERFVAHHGENVRYCYPWRQWLVWTGARWASDDTGRVHRLAKETVRRIYGEAAAAEDEGRRKALAQHATRSEAEGKIRAMLELVKSEVPVSPDELDADPFLLNTKNGTIDFRSGDLCEHRREDLITKITPGEYDPDAKAPEWERFLERVLPGEDLRAFVQRASGYSATGDTSEQCMFINHGTGNNGKSTFQEALTAALGDYAMRAPTEMLMAKRSGGVPNDVARLKGARFVTASETEEGRRLAESLVKDLTGQDTISARFMRAEWFDFRPTHKLWLSTNHKPEIRGTDNAIWRRIRLVPWAVTVPPAERDKKLPEKLRAELPGILTWVVRGCIEWQREGLRAPDEVRRATGEYRAEMDVLAGFISDCCVADSAAWVKFKDLYAAYQQWCSESGERPESKQRLGNHLKERGYEPDRGTGNVPIRRGIGLRDDHKPDPADGSKVTQGNWSYPTVTPQNPRKSQETEEESYSSYPESHINGSEEPSREITEKQGNSGNWGNSKAPDNDEDVRGGGAAPGLVEGLLQTPPKWLADQLAKCRQDPDRWIKPTCSSIATEVYSSAARWREVKPAVDRWLGNLDAAGDEDQDLEGLEDLYEEDR
jgi:putative DNA primase/helicase